MLYYHRYPGVAQLVERVVWDHEAAGSRPVTRTTSEQSPLCSDVFLCLWQKKTSSARSLAPPFQIEPAALGFDLVLGGNLEALASILLRYFSSSQATYRLRRAFSFYYKAHRALILLLLASNCDPLRWARSWWAAGSRPVETPLRGGSISSREIGGSASAQALDRPGKISLVLFAARRKCWLAR